MPTYDAVDLFAGPGGWDVAANQIGLRTIGIEFDKTACLTRRAAGLATVEGDVRAYGPACFADPILYAEQIAAGVEPTVAAIVAGLIASPPCQTFSMAGKGAGRNALDVVLAAITAMANREAVDYASFSDERTGLVLEPLRWILEAKDDGMAYEWIALEQVPTVLPVWQAMAAVLEAEGYNVAVGNVQAEQYGVPQTRKRAILVARRDCEVSLPTPTHSRYHNRTPDRLDVGVAKWVSMAEALGWTGDVVCRSNYGSGGDPKARGERHISEPAATVTSKVDRNKWSYHASTQANAAVRCEDLPAPTLCFGHDSASVRWKREGESVNVSRLEAACLQSFPDGFPWQGNKGKQFQQIGNAIPPLLAKAVLSAVAFSSSVTANG